MQYLLTEDEYKKLRDGADTAAKKELEAFKQNTRQSFELFFRNLDAVLRSGMTFSSYGFERERFLKLGRDFMKDTNL